MKRSQGMVLIVCLLLSFFIALAVIGVWEHHLLYQRLVAQQQVKAQHLLRAENLAYDIMQQNLSYQPIMMGESLCQPLNENCLNQPVLVPELAEQEQLSYRLIALAQEQHRLFWRLHLHYEKTMAVDLTIEFSQTRADEFINQTKYFYQQQQWQVF